MHVKIVVAAALISEDKTVFVQKRPEGRPMAGFWEFPGGKVEEGESPSAALARELTEELGIVVLDQDLIETGFSVTPLGDGLLLLLLYRCENWHGTLVALDGQETRWLRPECLESLDMPEADLRLIPQLRLGLNG